ncbi:ATP-binding cassette domain-containing protein [Microbacterium sp. P04]|uniref:ATP-binding cassette domain-containing protein n=1 Tax=Microbacterium sp. P04 TaxID=3366947 RepID=UPI0037463780
MAATLAPLGVALATGAVLGALPTSSGSSPNISTVVPPLALFLAVAIVVNEAAATFKPHVDAYVASRIDAEVRSRVRLRCDALPFAIVESEEFQVWVRDACDAGASSRFPDRTVGAAAAGQGTVVARFLGAGLATALISTVSVPLALTLLLVSLVVRVLVRRQWTHLARLEDLGPRNAKERQVFEGYLTDPRFSRELRVLGVSGWLIERWDTAAQAARREYQTELVTVLRRQGLTTVLAFLVGSIGFGGLGLSALQGTIGLSELGTSLIALYPLFTISFIGREALSIDYGLTGFRAYQKISTFPADSISPDLSSPTARPTSPPKIELEAIGFTYPDSTKAVLDGLHLTISPGQTLGLVGVNGAGKTTLAKILAGLYEPSTGQIRTDGVDGAPRGRVAVVYQDFVRYPLTLLENVTLSASGSTIDRRAALECMEKAGLAQLLSDEGMSPDTLLWSTAEGGRSALSGGQWQRIALARALYAAEKGKDVIIMDEPTSQLDVDAEFRFHETILKHLANVTVILITHRLSTVRHANRIVLLNDGSLVESGSHTELVEHDGEYARLYRLQADRFATEAETEQ